MTPKANDEHGKLQKIISLKFLIVLSFLLFYNLNMFRKMLRDKDKRDTALLIFMAAITIAFILYIFIPFGKEEKKRDQSDEQGKKIVKKEHFYDELNKKIGRELNSVYLSILISTHPFENYRLETLENVFDEFKNDTLDKLSKFSFYDLKEILTLPLPDEYNNALKFNLFLSLFLIKQKEEGIIRKLEALPKNEFQKIIDFDFYQLENNEVQKDYQLMPVLFYFTMLMKRLPIYPAEDNVHFFIEKIKPIRDLTTAKYLIQIRELFRFSASVEPYLLHWVEHDAIGPDDKRIYGNLNLKTFAFLGQTYLMFPDPENPENNLWMKDLCVADSGDIELTDFKIMSKDPSTPLDSKKILYTPVNSEFVVLLKEYETLETHGFLTTMVKKRISDFHKSVTVINFSVAEAEEESFKTQLEQFGNYLKKNSDSNGN